MNQITTDVDRILRDISKTFIGFERAFSNIHSQIGTGLGRGSTSTFPPYNILQHTNDSYTIELALAGYDPDDIDIEVEKETLTISSRGNDGKEDSETVYRGIAQRAFKLYWTLAENVEVESASFNNGILQIFLKKITKEEDKPRKIPIDNKPKKLEGTPE